MTTEELIQQATKTAEKMAERVKLAYIASVTKNVAEYLDSYEPDEDDFFAWIEGYDWGE